MKSDNIFKEIEGQPIYDFKPGEIIIRVKSTQYPSGYISMDFHEPMQLVAIENNQIYLNYVDDRVITDMVNVPVEIFGNNWTLFKKPSPLKISPSQRIVNILQNAVTLGFEIHDWETKWSDFHLEDIDPDFKEPGFLYSQAEEFLIARTEPESIEFCLDGIGVGNADEWYDGFGYKIPCYRTEAVDNMIKTSKDGTIIYHTFAVDSRGIVIRLFHEVKNY